MPTAEPTISRGAARPTKPPTKIKHTITLSSVGKALADVMNKDGAKNGALEKQNKKSKEPKDVPITRPGSRARASIDTLPSSSRGASLDMAPVAFRTRGALKAAFGHSETKLSQTENFNASSISLSRASSLKPKSAATLPKYRPSSTEPSSKNPSLTKVAGNRKSGSTSSDKSSPSPSPAPSELPRRSISPHKRLVKHNRSASETPQSTTKKEATLSATKAKTKVPPNKAPSGPPPSKSATSSTILTPSQPATRPPSSASAHNVSTPTKFRKFAGFGFDSSSKQKPPVHVTLQTSPITKGSSQDTTASSSENMSASRKTPLTPPVEDNSYDSIDVEFMLGAPTSPSAPTPAIPRIREPWQQTERDEPTTPPRSNGLPTRADLSYLSPLPNDSPPSLRPNPKKPGNERGSLLSWDQIAAANNSADEAVDISHMLSDIPAPFMPGFLSPAPSTIMELPDSPGLSTVSLSPVGYASISRVLLPDVTPSPAPLRLERSTSSAASEAAMNTMLRLQLAQQEHMAKERLDRIQSLEKQLHNEREAHEKSARELAQQVTEVEAALRAHMEATERRMAERDAQIATLQGQLKQSSRSKKNELEQAVEQTRVKAATTYSNNLQMIHTKWEAAGAGQQAAGSWSAVASLFGGHLELVKTNREVLAVLLSGLDHTLDSLRAQAQSD